MKRSGMHYKKPLCCQVILLIIAIASNAQKINFNHGWQFTSVEFANSAAVDSFRRLGNNWNDQFLVEKTDVAGSLESQPQPSFEEERKFLNGHQWQKVDLPHTAFPEPLVIVQPREGIAWYSKSFKAPVEWKKKTVSIHFEGVMQVSQVWVNGQYMGTFAGGYLPFEIALNKVLHYGEENSILLKADNRANPVVPPGKPVEKLDFIYYSGIYRDVWLNVKNDLHITSAVSAGKVAGGGIFVTYPEVSATKAIVDIQTHIENTLNGDATFIIKQELLDKAGKTVVSNTTAPLKLEQLKDKHFVQQLQLNSPDLWYPDHPNLYRLRTTVIEGNTVVDSAVTRIGIRNFEITKEKGLLVNGRPCRLMGTNRHQNYPYIGNALSHAAAYRDAWLIKSAGMNAVRMAHYPPDPAFLDAADELGLLIVDCIPGWQFFNRNEAFTELVFSDIRQMIRRDRNHASVLLWEVSLNESNPPADFRCKQAEVARSEWRGNNNFFTSGDSYYVKACWDVPYDDWNDDPGARNNTTYKDNAFLVREYGDYEFGGGNSTTRQLRSSGEKGMLQQAWNLQWEHNKNIKQYPHAIGDLSWAFFDGLAGVVVGIEGWGAADIFRIPKYSYYFFKSQQPVIINPAQPFASGPMLFIAKDLNSTSDTNKVVVYSNCEEVLLYEDGMLIARKKPDDGPESDYGTDFAEGGHIFDGGNANNLDHPPFTFAGLKLTGGELKAVGLIGGKPAATYAVRKAGKPAAINIEAASNGKSWQANGDIIFVYVKLTDAVGTQLTDGKLPVSLEVKGDAALVSPAKVDAEAGIASFLLKSGKSGGTVTLHATAPGLAAGKLTLSPR